MKMQNSVGTYLLPIDILPIGNLPRYCLFLEFIIFYTYLGTIFFRKMCVSNDNNYYFNILYYDVENIIENMYIVFYIINTKLMPIIILENLTKLIKPYRYLGR